MPTKKPLKRVRGGASRSRTGALTKGKRQKGKRALDADSSVETQTKAWDFDEHAEISGMTFTFW